jgi:hypothetical protein
MPTLVPDQIARRRFRYDWVPGTNPAAAILPDSCRVALVRLDENLVVDLRRLALSIHFFETNEV